MDEKLIPKIDFNEYSKDKYLLDLGDYAIEKCNGKIYLVKKSRYPKTYVECCSILKEPILYLNLTNIFDDFDIDFNLEKFRQLLICRKAYWKIAGEDMGLHKHWEPDWNKDKDLIYCIIVNRGIISKQNFRNTQFTFAFPTKEMRDAFYENFKDLIESCKELL